MPASPPRPTLYAEDLDLIEDALDYYRKAAEHGAADHSLSEISRTERRIQRYLDRVRPERVTVFPERSPDVDSHA